MYKRSTDCCRDAPETMYRRAGFRDLERTATGGLSRVGSRSLGGWMDEMDGMNEMTKIKREEISRRARARARASGLLGRCADGIGRRRFESKRFRQATTIDDDLTAQQIRRKHENDLMSLLYTGIPSTTWSCFAVQKPPFKPAAALTLYLPSTTTLCASFSDYTSPAMPAFYTPALPRLTSPCCSGWILAVNRLSRLIAPSDPFSVDQAELTLCVDSLLKARG